MQKFNTYITLFQNQTTDGISINSITGTPYFDLQYDVIDLMNPITGAPEIVEKPNNQQNYVKAFALAINGVLGSASLTLQYFDPIAGDLIINPIPDYTNNNLWSTTGLTDENSLINFGTNPSNLGKKGILVSLPYFPLKYRLVLSGSGGGTDITSYVIYSK